MKTILKAWIVLTFFTNNPVFSQDTTHPSGFCFKKPKPSTSNQIEIDPVDLITPGNETELLNEMTRVVKEKMFLDLQVSSNDMRISDDSANEDAVRF